MYQEVVGVEVPNLLLAPFAAVAEESEFKLPLAEKIGLDNLVFLLREQNLNHPIAFLKTARRLCPILLPRLHRKLNSLKYSSADLVYLHNLPEYKDEKSTQALSVLIASMLGNPLQFKQQNYGDIAAKITPEPGRENTNSSSGRMKFGWHTDDSFLDETFRTDFLLLAGHYNPSNVRTFVSSLENIKKTMDPDLFFELMKPQFKIGLPSSFRLDSNATLKESPIVWLDGSRRVNIAFSEYNVRANHSKAKEAISALLEATEHNTTSFNLQSGNMVVFKNNRVIHARGQIIGDRTIFRVYIKESLSHLRNLPHSTGFVFDLEKIMNEMNSPLEKGNQ